MVSLVHRAGDFGLCCFSDFFFKKLSLRHMGILFDLGILKNCFGKRCHYVIQYACIHVFMYSNGLHYAAKQLFVFFIIATLVCWGQGCFYGNDSQCFINPFLHSDTEYH